MTSDNNSHEQLYELLQENQKLLNQNNELLKKLHRASVWSLWMRIVWFLVIIGVPFVLYYFVVEPYFERLGSSFETFQQGLQEVPGWKQFYQSVSGDRSE